MYDYFIPLGGGHGMAGGTGSRILFFSGDNDINNIAQGVKQ